MLFGIVWVLLSQAFATWRGWGADSACLRCLPTCVPVADDAPAFPRSCPALSPCVGWCLPVPPVLSPFVSLLISLSWMVCPRFWSLVSLLIFLCWMVRLPCRGLVPSCPPLSPLVSHCLPACVPHMCACVVWPPSRGLASPCLFFSPHICACVGWCVRLPEVLPPLVSHRSLPFCVPVFGWYDPLVSHCSPYICACFGFPRSCLRLSLIVSPQVRLSWMVCPLSWGLVSHGLPSCVPLLDGMPAFPSCLPLFPVSPTASNCLSWSPHMWVRLPEVLSPLVSLLVSLRWMVRLPSPCFGLSPIVSLFVSLCWMVCLPEDLPPLSASLSPSLSPSLPDCLFPSCSLWCPPSRGLGSLVSLTSLSPSLFPFLGWCARLPKALSPSLSPSLFLFLFPFVWWCVRLPEALSLFSLAYLPACLPSCFPLLGGVSAFPLVSHCLPSFFPLLDGLSAFPSPCPVCLPACVPVCWKVRPPSYGLASIVSQLFFPACLPACFSACPPACLPACLPARLAACLSLVPQLK